MSIVRLTLLVFIIALPIAVRAQTPTVQPRSEIEIRGIVAIPSGKANFSDTGNPDSTLNFSRDFDFANGLGFQLRYTYRTSDGKHKLQGSYEAISWERNTTLTRSFTFRGQTYVANANIDGNLKHRTFRAMYAYRWGNEKFRFGPMVDTGVIDVRLDITGTTNNGTSSTEGSVTKFGATVGYDLDYDPTPNLNLFSNLGVIAFRHDRLFHTEGGVRYYPAHNFGVVGGYKYRRYRWVNDDNFLRMSLPGPFFGLLIRF